MKYPDEIEVFGLVNEELSEPLAAHEDETVMWVSLAERI